MANSSVNTIRIHGIDGDVADVTSNRLDVNAYLSATPTIDIGDVSLLLGGTAASVDNGTSDATTLRVTVATDAPFVQREDSTHNSGHYGVMPLAVRNDVLTALSGSDGDYAPLQVSDIGGLFVTGSQKENVATVSEVLLIGGRYDSSARTLDDGDAGAVALNASGHMLIDVVDGGQLDALLDTIKVDTEAIETAVEILDNAISGNELQVDVVAALPAGTNIIGKVGHDMSAIISDVNDDVDTSAEVLKSTTACKRVDLMADPDNTGHIWVGDSGVQNDGTGGGIRLSSGDFYSIDIDDTADIYVAATVADQKVRFIYFT